MGIREITRSGAFVAAVLALVVVLLPFGLEEVGETTGLFKFPVKKTITGWLSPAGGARAPRGRMFAPVNWERYRHDLEEFTKWAEERSEAAISLPLEPVVITVEEKVAKPESRIWPVPVASCTAGDQVGRGKGYVFISGIANPMEEGAVIAPSEGLCGYEIVFVGERSVWFRVVLAGEEDSPMGVVKFPEFTRVDGESIVRGNRKYVARDAFPLASGGWLMIDSFVPPDGTLFKILDEKRREVASILCVVIGEKGGR